MKKFFTATMDKETKDMILDVLGGSLDIEEVARENGGLKSWVPGIADGQPGTSMWQKFVGYNIEVVVTNSFDKKQRSGFIRANKDTIISASRSYVPTKYVSLHWTQEETEVTRILHFLEQLGMAPLMLSFREALTEARTKKETEVKIAGVAKLTQRREFIPPPPKKRW